MAKPPLWQKQVEGVKYLMERRHFALFYEMGAGKTRTAIEALKLIKPSKALVVCPKSVGSVWLNQLDQWGWPWPVVNLIGEKQKVVAKAKRIGDAVGLVLINYDIVWRPEITAALTAWRPQVVICDESHRIKAPFGRASKAIYHISKEAGYRWLLTGTPMPHSPLDIFAQFRFMQPKIFGRLTDFRKKYCVMGGYKNKQVVGFNRLDDLHWRIACNSHQVKTCEVQELPETVSIRVDFELGRRAQEIYRQLERDFVAELELGTLTVPNILVKLLRLQQLTGGFLRADDSEEVEQVDSNKLEACLDIIDGTRESVVVFCQFLPEIDAILRACDERRIPAWELSGRRNQLHPWNLRGRVLVVQIKAGSEGIDLTKARYAVFYSTGFNLGALLQAQKRLHRPGQRRTVFYYHLSAKWTIDEKVAAALERRQDLVQAVLEGKLRKSA